MSNNNKKYSEGKIYKIEPKCDHNDDEIYIGSTTQKYLSQRMVEHRSQYKRWKEGKMNLVSSFQLFEKFGIDNCEIILLESVVAKDINELKSRESHHIKNIKCINKYVPLRSHKDYRNDNKELISSKAKKLFKCECGSKCRIVAKQRHFRTNKHLNYIKSKTI